MPDTYFIIPESQHNALTEAVYRRRGYLPDDGRRRRPPLRRGFPAWHPDAQRHQGAAPRPSLRLRLKGLRSRARIEEIPTRFADRPDLGMPTGSWGSPRPTGRSTPPLRWPTATASAPFPSTTRFHYLWGGGYVMDAARRGYIAYTNCTAALAEVVPFEGKFPTLGTNPIPGVSPPRRPVGFPIVIDWATSVIAMGRVQQLKREGRPLPPMAALDQNGQPTTDPGQATSLLPFGAHKGYGLSLINEIVGALIGGSLPTLRSRWEREPEEKHACTFFFQVVHPEAVSCGAFARGRDQAGNVKAVIADILGHGNERCLLPGQVEADWARRSAAAGGLLFTQAEIEAFNELAAEAGLARWESSAHQSIVI